MYCCKFCGRQTNSKSGNSFHENRCKNNPLSHTKKTSKIFINNGIIELFIDISDLCKYPGWNKGYLKLRTNNSPTKNKIVINNGNKHKYINKDEINFYLNNGWYIGVTDEFKNKIKRTSKGIALTPEKELLRKQKISNTMKNNPKAGGYRKGSGIGKSGWYKNIWCDSLWELAFVVYHFDNKLNISRCKERRKYIFEGKEHVYIPDFVTDKGIIEIKGYKTKQWLEKEKQNPDIIVLGKNEIISYLKYVEEKYGKDFIKLYENN